MKFDRDRKWLFNKEVKQQTKRSLENQKKELEEAQQKLRSSTDEKEKEMLKTRIAFLEYNLKEKNRQKFTTGFQNWTISLGIGITVVVVIVVFVLSFIFGK